VRSKLRGLPDLRALKDNIQIFENKKTPDVKTGVFKNFGDDILSHRNCSTICAGGLNYSVRNGKRWAPPLESPKDLYLILFTGSNVIRHILKENTG
jgi:hypothetical protein